MKFTRDTLRTILALLLVIIIVVATFAYGNAQRNKQQAKNDAKVTQTQANDKEKSATVETPAPTTPQAPTATTPAAGGTAQVQPATIPETGGEAAYVAPLAIVALAGYFYLRSRQRLSFAQTR